jgi:hypothetical protein
MAPRATTRTTITAEERDKKLEIAEDASAAVKVIVQAAEEALKIVATNTAEALKISNAKSSGDHDLLIELNTRMDGLKTDIQNLTHGTSKTISDHETRILVLEKTQIVHESALNVLQSNDSDKRLNSLEQLEKTTTGKNKIILPLIIALSGGLGGLLVFIIEKLLMK